MYIMEMYLFCFVTFLALASVPEAAGSNCSSYYVLLHKHYDPAWERVVLNPLKETIDWNKYKIQSDVPELKRLDHHCVIDLDCKNVDASCVAKIKPTIMTGTDDRIVNPEPSFESTTYNTKSDKDSSYLDEIYFKDISSKTTTDNLKLNETTPNDNTTIITETLTSPYGKTTELRGVNSETTTNLNNVSDLELSDASDTVNLTNTDTSILTKTTTDNNNDDYTTIIAETSSYQETSTIPNNFSKKDILDTGDAVNLTKTYSSTLTKTTTDDNDDNYTTIIAETSSYQETSTNPNNFSKKEVSDAGDAVHLTNTDTSTLTKTTTDDTTDDNNDDYTTIIAETSSYQESSTNDNNFSKKEVTNNGYIAQTPIASTVSTRYDEITDNNKHLTTTDTTVNTEIINVTLNESQSTTPVLVGKSGKYAYKPGEKTRERTSDGLQAGKIAAGIMGAGALVAVVLVVKKIVIGCLQSGVYHLPT